MQALDLRHHRSRLVALDTRTRTARPSDGSTLHIARGVDMHLGVSPLRI